MARLASYIGTSPCEGSLVTEVLKSPQFDTDNWLCADNLGKDSPLESCYYLGKMLVRPNVKLLHQKLHVQGPTSNLHHSLRFGDTPFPSQATVGHVPKPFTFTMVYDIAGEELPTRKNKERSGPRIHVSNHRVGVSDFGLEHRISICGPAGQHIHTYRATLPKSLFVCRRVPVCRSCPAVSKEVLLFRLSMISQRLLNLEKVKVSLAEAKIHLEQKIVELENP